MATLILRGEVAEVRLDRDDEDDQVIATCIQHLGSEGAPCSWTEAYDDMNDAEQYAADHADSGRP